jgi:hypothetical protein
MKCTILLYKIRLFPVIFLVSTIVWAQSSNDYRSIKSGSWSDITTWQRFSVGSWKAATAAPNYTNANVITIQSGHTVNIPSSYGSTVDQVVVAGALQIDAGGSFVVRDGTGVDFAISGGSMSVFGVFALSNLATTSGLSTSSAFFQSGSRYQHYYTSTEGTIPSASWNANSTVQILGYSTTSIQASSAGNWGQNFGHVEFNCVNLRSGITFNWNGKLSNIQGDLLIKNTGLGSVWLVGTSNATITIGGDIDVSGTSILVLNYSSTSTFNVDGDFDYTTTNVTGSNLAVSGTTVLNVSGSFIMNASGGKLSFGSQGSGHSTLNLTGDFSFLNGTIDEASTSTFGTINFTGSGLRYYTRTNGVIGVGRIIHFSIGSNAILDVGTSSLIGGGDFGLSGTLRLGSTSSLGALQTGAASGSNLQTTGSRSFHTGSVIEYNGTGNQYIGNGHPNNIAVDLIINNSATVTLLKNVTANSVTLQAGQLVANGFDITLDQNWTVNSGSYDAGTGTVYFTGTSQVTGSGTASFGNLTVNTSSSLSFPNANVFISGNLTVSSGATLTANSGTVIFNGGATQSISSNGTTFNNVTVNKSAGSVTLVNALNLQGVLTMQTATTFASNGFLTLLSTNDQPASDASIAALVSGSSVTGNVTVQRYFRAADDYDRFISSPVSNATVAQLQNAFAVTGDFTGTSYPCTGCLNNGASLFWYKESVAGVFSKGYKGFPSVGGTNGQGLVPGLGFDAYMWNGVAPAKINFTGTINSGSIALGIIGGSSLTYTTSSPASSADGWNLVGNPYPSAIQWNNGSGWTKSNIDPTVWVWDVVARIWRSYNANTSVGNLSNGIIALGQGFWVKVASPGNGSIVINEQAKSVSGNGSYYRDHILANARIVLAHKDFKDEAFIVTSNNATNDFDLGLDAEKLITGIERLSVSLMDDKKRKLGHYAVSKPVEKIPVHIAVENDGEYSFTFENFENLEGFKDYYLLDSYTGEATSLASGSTYTFVVTSNTTSSIDDRFFITNLSGDESTELRLSCFPNRVSDVLNIFFNSEKVETISIVDNVGRVISGIPFESENGMSKAAVNMSDYSSGFYFVKLISGQKVYLKKIIKL